MDPPQQQEPEQIPNISVVSCAKCGTLLWPQVHNGKVVGIAPCPICTHPVVIKQEPTPCLLCGQPVVGDFAFSDSDPPVKELRSVGPCEKCGAEGGMVIKQDCALCHGQVVYPEMDHDRVFRAHLRKCLGGQS